MQGAAEVRRRKRRSNRAVVAGLALIVVAVLLSSREVAPAVATTLAAIVGFGLLMYGVHVAWLVFYEREPDGPSS
jgi:Flp pilus assembly protein protease CpaA